MTELEFQKLLQRYLDGHCMPGEEKLVEQLYKELSRPEPAIISESEQHMLLEAMWQRLEARTQLPAPEGKVIHRPLSFWQSQPRQWAAAALLALTIGAGLLLPRFHSKPQPAVGTPATAIAQAAWTQHLNTSAHEQAIALPDGSQVSLNPGGSLRYMAGLTGPKREVYLSGEAFFKVSKNPGRPFLVFTKQVVTTVLGTSFRVRALEGSTNATVMVREGRVAVQARAGAQLDATPNRPATAGVLLLPNQQVVYSAAAHHLRKELVAKPVVLAPQSFVFDDRPVPEVLTALQKAYGVDIVYDRETLANCTVTLALTDQSLYKKLDVLCETLGATYEQSEARILFHSKGCKSK
jgi:transmembrane sensor